MPSAGRVSYINASGSQPKSNTRNDRIQRLSSRSEKNKVESQHRKFKSSCNKNNHVLDCNANVKNVDLSSNYANVCLSCNECLFSSNHEIIEIVLYYLDSGCSKHMTGQREKLINFVSKFIGLGHNLFSVRQLCDLDLEVAFRKHTCFVRNSDGVDILSGSRGTKLYTISMKDRMKSSPICLLSKASKTKSWLWHHRLSHLNFNTINKLAKQDLVRGLPKLKYAKDHLCSTCQMGKSKKESHKPKPEPSSNAKLHTLHLDLCGSMRVESINGKKYILVIIDDYSRGIEFINQTLRTYTEDNGITHQTCVARTPQQNGVDERPVSTTCYTQNRSLIHTRYNKTPYELLRDRKPDLKFLHVFGALCYLTNNSEDLRKLQLKADIGIFIGYSSSKKA
ncbi:retrovirus-related pol polyprotein from transposon TNT 1-94 [Tanacetum coccineum]